MISNTKGEETGEIRYFKLNNKKGKIIIFEEDPPIFVPLIIFKSIQEDSNGEMIISIM